MKNPRQFTRSQKEYLTKCNIDSRNWLMKEDRPNKSYFEIINKTTGRVLKVDRYAGSSRGVFA